MAIESYELESGVDKYLLEDSSGQLLIDQRVEVISTSTVGITEARNKSWVKVLISNMGLTDVVNTAKGFVKLASTILGLTESKNYQQTQWDYLLEDGTGFGYLTEDGAGIYIQDYPFINVSSTVGVTESSQKTLGFLKNITSTLGLTDIGINIQTGFVKVATQFIAAVEEVNNYLLTLVNFYELEDGTGLYINEDGTGGRYELDQLQIIQVLVATLGLTELSQKLLGPVKHLSDTVGLTSAVNRAMVMYRNVTLATVGITETKNRLGAWIRNLSSTVGITEVSNRLGVIKRNLSSTVGLTGVNNYLRGLSRTLTSTVGLIGVNNIITGIVYNIASTIGLVEVSNKIRSVFISNNLGDFITLASISLANFFVVNSYNNEDMTGVDSYNAGNLIIRDDN